MLSLYPIVYIKIFLMSTNIDLSIIILSYKSKDHLAVLLPSVFNSDGVNFNTTPQPTAGPLLEKEGRTAGPQYSAELIIVDNDSQDVGSVDADENSSLMSGPGDISAEDDARIHGTHHSHRPDITGLALLLKIEFWQLWALLGVLTGVGLMTIK